MAIVVPIGVPVYFWRESLFIAFLGCYVMRYTLQLHGVWLVNSAAHMFGHRQYNAHIAPTTLWSISFFGYGEGEAID